MRDITKRGGIYYRGDIYCVDFGEQTGSEQSGERPVLIVQNDIGNKYSPTVIVATITSRLNKKDLPTHVKLNAEECGLLNDSQVLLEQVYTVDKKRLKYYIGSVGDNTMEEINLALEISVQVGRSRNMFVKKEIKEIKSLVSDIKKLDEMFSIWFSKNTDIEPMMQFLEERELKIKDLERYASKANINYKEYYRPIVVNNNMKLGMVM